MEDQEALQIKQSEWDGTDVCSDDGEDGDADGGVEDGDDDDG